jgi:hypothetical protein
VAHHCLHEVKIILDVNRNIILGRPEEQLALDSFKDKFAAFNFRTKRVDGHGYSEVLNGLNFLMKADETLPVLIAYMDLWRFSAAPRARLSQLSFESDRAFPAQCRVPPSRIVEPIDVFKD